MPVERVDRRFTVRVLQPRARGLRVGSQQLRVPHSPTEVKVKRGGPQRVGASLVVGGRVTIVQKGTGDVDVTERVADEPLSALHVVREVAVTGHIVLARLPEPGALAPLGITVQSGQAGMTLRVVSAGPVTDPSWHWLPGHAVMLGLEGTLTQTEPATGHVVPLGTAVDEHTLLVRIDAPIRLSG